MPQQLQEYHPERVWPRILQSVRRRPASQPDEEVPELQQGVRPLRCHGCTPIGKCSPARLGRETSSEGRHCGAQILVGYGAHLLSRANASTQKATGWKRWISVRVVCTRIESVGWAVKCNCMVSELGSWRVYYLLEREPGWITGILLGHDISTSKGEQDIEPASRKGWGKGQGQPQERTLYKPEIY